MPMVADHDLVVEVLSKTEVMSCFPDDLYNDPALFHQACHAAANKVPFVVSSFHKRKLATRQIEMRMQEAITFRNKWYRDNLKRLPRD